MTRIFLFILISWIFFTCPACKNNSVSIPPEIIDRDTMTKIYTDLHIMEALTIQGSIKYNDSLNSVDNYKQEILNKYNLDIQRFDESYRFYINHPQLLDQIYNDVLIELSKKKAEAEN